MNNIVFLGPPFAGKGTQCKALAASTGMLHLSTGAAIRSEVEAGTALGQEADRYQAQGLLAPDDLVASIVEAFILKHRDGAGFLFDGYPRNLAQVKKLIEILGTIDESIDRFLVVEVPESTLKARAAQRAIEEDRDDDKDPAIIARRLKIYQEETAPIIAYAEAEGFTVKKIDGLGSVSEVQERVLAAADVQND